MTVLFEQYPALQRLHDWAIDRQLSISVEAIGPGPASVDSRTLTIKSPGKPAIRLTVLDEYNDARQDNILLCLTLIDMEFGELDDADNLESWARANGLDGHSEIVRKIYQDNSAGRSVFLDLYGRIPDAISDYDWSLNAGSAQALRASTERR